MVLKLSFLLEDICLFCFVHLFGLFWDALSAVAHLSYVLSIFIMDTKILLKIEDVKKKKFCVFICVCFSFLSWIARTGETCRMEETDIAVC